MISRSIAVILIFSVLLSGCSLYRNYPFEHYEKSEPSHRLAFNMNDGTIYPVDASEIALAKNTADSYIIYFKNGELLKLRKDEIASVMMYDEKLATALGIGIGIVLGVLVVGGMLYLLSEISWY